MCRSGPNDHRLESSIEHDELSYLRVHKDTADDKRVLQGVAHFELRRIELVGITCNEFDLNTRTNSARFVIISE